MGAHTHPGRLPRIGATAFAVPVVSLGMWAAGARPAWAANTVNATFHAPAWVDLNPCFPGDMLNLNGDIHVVITATGDARGGYHTTLGINSELRGVSITTGTGYVSSENHEEEWYAGAPFPAVHSSVHHFDLISTSSTYNYVLHVQMHETVTANGMPAATVDTVRADCKG